MRSVCPDPRRRLDRNLLRPAIAQSRAALTKLHIFCQANFHTNEFCATTGNAKVGCRGMVGGGKLLLDLCRTGLNSLRRGAILRRNLYLAKRLLDSGKIIRRREASAGAVRCPLMLNESASRHDCQHAFDRWLRHRPCRGAILRMGTVVVLRPQTMHDKTEVSLGIAFARRRVAGVGGAELRRPGEAEEIVVKADRRIFG